MLIRTIKPFWISNYPVNIGRVLDVDPRVADFYIARGCCLSMEPQVEQAISVDSQIKETRKRRAKRK